MSLDFNFSIEELDAAEATINPYLSSPARGMKLFALLTGHPAPESVQQEQRERLDRLHRLIHKDFIDLTARCSYSNETLAMQHLLAWRRSWETLSCFPI